MGRDKRQDKPELPPGTLERKQLKQEVADFERVLEAIMRVMQTT
jgi:hypothetical protein